MSHSHPAPADITIMFEHCSHSQLYHDLPSPSGPSSPSHSSPTTPVDLYSSDPHDLSLAEDSWNLIPYDVPWGSEYYHYRAGTLPGPDGACIFLRSPTPLKNRRTQKACNKCRQRKAKCSGSRPACSRCLARGYICEYVEEEPKRPAHTSSRPRARARADSEYSERDDASYSPSDSESVRYTPSSSSQPKSEDSEPSTPDLLYADPDATSYPSTASPAEFAPHWDDSHHHPYTMAAAYGYESVAESYAAETAAMRDYYPLADDVHAGVGAPQDAGAVYHDFHPDPHQPHPASVAAASVHAPRPVRCSGSPPFLTPEERLGAFVLHVDAAQGMPANPMLIDLAAGAPAPAPQISIPQVPAMPSPTEPTLAEAAVEYSPQGMYYYQADVTAGVQQYPPYLQYQYAMPAYAPQGSQEAIEPAMLYSMPMLSAGMTA